MPGHRELEDRGLWHGHRLKFTMIQRPVEKRTISREIVPIKVI
jgi:hypothetical protein